MLFGSITTAGIRMLIEEKIDYSRSRNLILTSVILVIGLSGAHILVGEVDLKGMALATIVAIVLSLGFMVIDALQPQQRVEVEWVRGSPVAAVAAGPHLRPVGCFVMTSP